MDEVIIEYSKRLNALESDVDVTEKGANMDKFCSFDIEIAEEISDDGWDTSRPLGISCAATLLSGDEEAIVWYDGQYRKHFGPRMTKKQCQELVEYLLAAKRLGYIPLTWNGLGFDFKVLAQESGLFEECRELALDHVDMMFQFHCIKGFPIGLDAACHGMGLEGKPDGMHGSLAPTAWRDGRYQEVLDYVANDVVQPLKLAELVIQKGYLAWVTRAGGRRSVPISKWLTVRDSLKLAKPDVSWMGNPRPRSKFSEWALE